MTKNKHTPKDFAPHLLAVLAEKAGNQPNVTIPMEQTYTPVCERMGILESYGGESTHGSPYTHRQIGLAMRQHLRNKGLGLYGKKGSWGLTEKGIQSLKEVVESSVETSVESFIENVSKSELPLVMTKTTKEEISVSSSHPYSEDPYLRSLAIGSLSCFGAFLEKNPTCGSCPFTKECLLHAETIKAQIASDLEAEEAALRDALQRKIEEEQRKEQSVAELIQSFGDTSKKDNKSKYQLTKDVRHAVGEARQDNICFHCNNPIIKGATFIWVHHEGVLHPECVEIQAQNPEGVP